MCQEDSEIQIAAPCGLIPQALQDSIGEDYTHKDTCVICVTVNSVCMWIVIIFLVGKKTKRSRVKVKQLKMLFKFTSGISVLRKKCQTMLSYVNYSYIEAKNKMHALVSKKIKA